MLYNMNEHSCEESFQNEWVNTQTMIRTKDNNVIENQNFMIGQRINQMFMEYEMTPNQNQPCFFQPCIQQNSPKFEVNIHSFMNPMVQPSYVFKEEQTAYFHSNFTQPKKTNRGRKPSRLLSEEEEEKRAIRRERNKLAAARCRKRRLDHTNQLIQENERLENEEKNLKFKLEEIQNKRNNLQIFIDNHNPCVFRKNGEAKEPVFSSGLNTNSMTENKDQVRSVINRNIVHFRERPTNLSIPSLMPGPVNISRFLPSTEGTPFNYESLMEGGTGLTPTSAPLIPSFIMPQRNTDCIDLANTGNYVSL